jgi:hypothetical protein
MTKSSIAGMVGCVALAVFAGNASAYVRKPIYRPHAQALSSPELYRPQERTLAALSAKGGPLHDCVHVTFPQCDGHEFGGPND